MKNHLSFIARSGIALAIMISCQLSAQETSTWPYDRLRNQADLIVIAAADKSEDTGELVNSPLLGVDFVGVNTTFQVRGVLDGRYREDTLTVFHLRAPDGKTLPQPSRLVQFQTIPIPMRTITGRDYEGKVEYLLYLNRRKDGRFEPVSGLLDAIFSVRELNTPLAP